MIVEVDEDDDEEATELEELVRCIPFRGGMSIRDRSSELMVFRLACLLLLECHDGRGIGCRLGGATAVICEEERTVW